MAEVKTLGRSPSAESNLPPNSKSSTSSQRSTAPATDASRPVSPDGPSPIPSTSSINLANLPGLPEFESSLPLLNGKNGSSVPRTHKARPSKRRKSLSSAESSNENDALEVPETDLNRHASSSLSDQSSKSASPEPTTIPSPLSSPMKKSSSKLEVATGNHSSSDSDLEDSQSFNGRRGRGRPRVSNRSKNRAQPTASGASSRAMNSPVAEIPLLIARATRATVALPPGYIEGVKSTRMPKGSARAESSGVEEDLKAKKIAKGKGKERESSIHSQIEVKEEELESEMRTEPEQEPEPAPIPERVFSKRRKIEDELIAERSSSRARLMQLLDEEAELINNETHPLIQHTFQKLNDEKQLRLAQLLDLREHQEMQIDRNLDVETEAVWRQWADAKDSLRMDLYLTNHNNLKQLISEEREYPFLRDHPLLVNSHGLPPVPYYRAPLPPPVPGEVRRHDIRSTAHLQPPPLNRAADHSAWKLTTREIETDLAIFADFNTSNSLSRSLSMTIEQPYGAVHYAPASTPPVFQPPSAALASSAYFHSQHHANSPRLPHDNGPSRPPNIFPQPSIIKPMWATPGKPNLGNPHHSNSQPPPSHLQGMPQSTGTQRTARTNGVLNSQPHGEMNSRPRAESATSSAKSPIDPSNWFAQPIGHQQARPVESRQAEARAVEHRREPQKKPEPPRFNGVPSAAVRPPAAKESWENWRPKVRESPNNFAARPNHQWNNGNGLPPSGMPPPTSNSTPVVTKPSAFAAYEPQAIPIFRQKK